MKNLIKISILTSCCLLFNFTLAIAALEFHPHLMIEESYNDNIYLSDGNEEDDWITTLEPGITIDYNNRFLAASVDYSLYYQFYNDHSEENQDNFEDVQRANATALFFGGRPFTLTLSEVISREVIDESERNADYNEIVNRSTVYNTTVTPEYRLQLFPTLSLVFGGTYERFDYVDSRGNDSEEHEGRVSLVKQLSATTELFGRYAFSRYLSDNDIDEFERQDYVFGLNQRIGAKIIIALEGGYSDVEYDNDDDTDTTNLLASIDYQLSEPITVSINYSQDFTTTFADGLTETRETGAAIAYNKDSLSAAAELFWNNSDYVRVDREDESYGVRLDFSTALARAISVNFDVEYEKAEYIDDATDEDVNRFTIGSSLDYEYRRFVASLGYRYRINESDVSGNDYDNNIVTLSGALRF